LIIKYPNVLFIPVGREFSRVRLDDGRPAFLSTASSSLRSLRICTVANVWARLMTHSKVRSRLTSRLYAFAKWCVTSTCNRFLIRSASQLGSAASTSARMRRQVLQEKKIKRIKITHKICFLQIYLFANYEVFVLLPVYRVHLWQEKKKLDNYFMYIIIKYTYIKYCISMYLCIYKLYITI